MRIKHKKFVLVLLFLTSACVPLAAWFESLVDEAVLGLERGHVKLSHEIERVELKMAHRLESLAEDATLQKNFDWNLQNSVSRYLDSGLQSGLLSQILIVDSDCRVLQSADLGNRIPLDCQLINPNGAKSGNRFWVQVGDAQPILALWYPLRIQGQKVSMVGMLRISEVSDLRESKAFPWSIVSYRSDKLKALADVIAPSAPIADGEPMITPTFLLEKIAVRLPAWHKGVLPFLAVSVLLLSLWYFGLSELQMSSAQNSHRLEMGRVLDYFKSILGDDWDINMSLEKMIISSTDQFSAFADERAEWITAGEKLRAELHQTRQKIAHLVLESTVSDQSGRTVESIQKGLEGMSANLAAIASRVRDFKNSTLHRLIDLSDQWCRGAEERNARKFLKSLSETAARDPDRFASRLHEELAVILSGALTGLDQANAITSLITTMEVEMERVGNLVGQWQSVFRQGAEVAPKDLMDQLLGIQALCSHTAADVSFMNFGLEIFDDQKNADLVAMGCFSLYRQLFEVFGSKIASIETIASEENGRTGLTIQPVLINESLGANPSELSAPMGNWSEHPDFKKAVELFREAKAEKLLAENSGSGVQFVVAWPQSSQGERWAQSQEDGDIRGNLQSL